MEKSRELNFRSASIHSLYFGLHMVLSPGRCNHNQEKYVMSGINSGSSFPPLLHYLVLSHLCYPANKIRKYWETYFHQSNKHTKLSL